MNSANESNLEQSATSPDADQSSRTTSEPTADFVTAKSPDSPPLTEKSESSKNLTPDNSLQEEEKAASKSESSTFQEESI